jgi:hypothetical protein
MMEELLPTGVAVVERWGDDESVYFLPGERAQVAKALENSVFA